MVAVSGKGVSVRCDVASKGDPTRAAVGSTAFGTSGADTTMAHPTNGALTTGANPAKEYSPAQKTVGTADLTTNRAAALTTKLPR